MEKNRHRSDGFAKVLSYILVAALTACVTVVVTITALGGPSKLDQLESVILECFIDEADPVAMEDAAAAAMVASLGDPWSYYIPADQYDLYLEQMENAYIGIGITIEENIDTGEVKILQVEPSGGAKAAGIQVGDILTGVEGQKISDVGIDAASQLIRGEEGTSVSVTVLREGQELTFDVVRQIIQVQVAAGQMLDGNVGYVIINNFDERCAQETINAVDTLLEQGAQSLIFDVRFNPGGYKTELVEVLDYLLPEGVLFRSVDYLGEEEILSSDASCLEMPMAVLINGESYSAAEFFAAALDEYDYAVVVGEPTTGKGRFQTTFELVDGSAVGLSIGKYFTPNGVSLADQGGLVPEVSVEVDEETAAKIYGGLLPPEEDPQIQAALEALK